MQLQMAFCDSAVETVFASGFPSEANCSIFRDGPELFSYNTSQAHYVLWALIRESFREETGSSNNIPVLAIVLLSSFPSA